MFLNSCYQAYSNNYSFWAQPYNVKEVHMAYGIYIFYISKLYEYFDTYIMLLKGNLNQVSRRLGVSLLFEERMTIFFFVCFADRQRQCMMMMMGLCDVLSLSLFVFLSTSLGFLSSCISPFVYLYDLVGHSLQRPWW